MPAWVILFALEALHRKHQQNNQVYNLMLYWLLILNKFIDFQLSVTDIKAAWKVPPVKHQLQVPYNKIKWNAQSSNHAIKHEVVDSNEN